MGKTFDLNIVRILDHWRVCNAIRELITNASDETIQSGCKKEIVDYDGITNSVVIRDFGSGIKIDHFTLNESKSKLASVKTTGQFGVGLKDAVAFLHRVGKEVLFRSRHGIMTVCMRPKHGFESIETLHVNLEPPKDPAFVGTEVIIRNVSPEDFNETREFFLNWSPSPVVFSCKYGQILDNSSSIYFCGIRIAQEKDFRYGYNITDVTPSMKKSMNRERDSVGRTAYSSRVTDILTKLPVGHPAIPEIFADLVGDGNYQDFKKKEVKKHIVSVAPVCPSTVYVTRFHNNSAIDPIRRSGKTVKAVSLEIHELMKAQDTHLTLETFLRLTKKTGCVVVAPKDLTSEEKNVLAIEKVLADLIFPTSPNYTLHVVEGMKESSDCIAMCEGDSIYISRTELVSVKSFVSCFVPQCVTHWAGKVAPGFEINLSDVVGLLAAKYLTK